MELRLSDRGFAAACADYAEVSRALEHLEADAKRTAQIRAERRRQQAALEEETAEFLAGRRRGS